MSRTIQADDGDELSVHPVQLSGEQIVVRLELQNSAYLDENEFDWITLTPEQARALGEALLSAASFLEIDVATGH